jgi:type I restriction-modification system DNA methylase subunit
MPFEEGTFDVVIGNPPYVSYGLRGVGKLSKWEQNLLKTLYNSAEYKINMYPLFMERSIDLTIEGGYSSLIVPDSFLLGRYFSKIRAYLLSNSEIKNVVFLPFKVFIGATIGVSVIYSLKKSKQYLGQGDVEVVMFRNLDELKKRNGLCNKYSQSYFTKVDYNRFRLLFKKEEFEMVNFIDTSCSNKIYNFLGGHTGVRSKIGQDKIISKISFRKIIQQD